MTKTDLTYEPSTLGYAKPINGPKPHDEKQQQGPQTGTSKPKTALPKDKLDKPRLLKDELDLPQAPRPPPSTPATDRPSSKFLTRRQSADFIRDELGRPMSFSTASKLAALGEFAEPRVWWGRRPLYTRDDLRQWVEARSRPTKQPVVEDKSRNGREPQRTEVQTLAMSPRATVQSPGVVDASTTRSTADQHCIHKTEVAQIGTRKGEAE